MSRLSYLFLLILSLCGPLAAAQDPFAADSAATRLSRQLLLYPQEKVHLQTDKGAYLSGERIWIRAHLVQATGHFPVPLSRYVHVELINPCNELVRRILIRPDSLGAHAGYLDLEESLPEGDYTLRAYTRYMLERGEEDLYRKTVRIMDPYSLNLETVPEFSFSERGIDLRLRLRDRRSGECLTPGAVTLTSPRKGTTQIRARDGVYETRLPREAAGECLLLGLRQDMRKYQRYLRIPWPAGEFDVALLPEGGHLIPDRACRVGVKAIRPDGLGEPVSGVVYDRDGNEVVRFGPLPRGMGSFLLRSEPGMSYYAECTARDGSTRRFDLPQAAPSARILQLIRVGSTLRVHLLQGEEAPAEPLSLLVHSGGMPLFHAGWDPQSPFFSFSLSGMPAGIVGFVLLDADLNIVSERLYFHFTDSTVVAPEARLSAPEYAPRDLIRVSFRWPEGIPEGDAVLGVGVVDREAAVPDRAGSLAATLLLTSELRGPVEDPAFYLTEEGEKERDALMLTQGWRRYDLPAVLKGRTQRPSTRPEQAIELRGKADPKIFASMEGGRISMYATLDSLTGMDFAPLQKDGSFCFLTEFPEGTEVTLQGQTRKGGKGNLLSADAPVWPSVAEAALPVRAEEAKAADWDAYMRQADEAYYLLHGDRSTLLDAAVVSADREEPEISSKWYSPVTASKPLTAAEIEKRHFTSILSVYLSTPGLAVRQNTLTTTRSDQPILPVIDDVVLPEFDLMLLNPEDIDNLFVIKDYTSMFGYYPGYTGALVITTTVGFTGNRTSDNISRIIPPGYQRPAAFYAPKYDTPEAREAGAPDLRTTLYWAPSVRFGSQDGLQVEFYAADRPSTYVLTGEGVTAEGRLMRLEAEIPVR